MADAMDTRIVEMQFNNKDFEKNISVSQKSLEKFKKELNFEETSKGLEDFSKSMKNVDFSRMESNIQSLTDKFTGLGNVGEFVLSRIRRTLEGLGDQVISFANSLTTVQAQAGFVKYETLNKSVQTLRSATGKEEKEIYAVLERLNKYTDETSYDFSQGVTSISQLVSSGAATLEQAEKTVEGFYNYAAKAGADTTKASTALQYSMVQAFQRGYLDWSNAKELSSRSMLTADFKETLLETAVALGTVTKENGKYYTISKKSKKQKKVEINTTNLFNDSLQHQWATSKVMNAALSKYADTTTKFGEEAYAAAQRCTTFTDALNAWKDMLSTGWMTTYRTVFGDLSDAMSLFSAVCNKVSEALDGLVQTRNKILTAWAETGGRDSLMGMLFGELEDPDGKTLFEGAHGLLDIITQVGDMISGAWWNTIKNLIPKDQQQMILDEYNRHIDAINMALIKQGQGDLVITKPFESFEELWNSEFAKGTGFREGIFGGRLQQATEDVQKFVERIHEWFSTVDDNAGTTRLEKIQAVLNAVFNTISFGFDIIGSIIDVVGVIFQELEPGLDAVGTFFATLAGGIEEGEQKARESGALTKFFSALGKVLAPVAGAVSDILVALSNLLTAIFKSNEATEGVVGVWGKLKSVLSKIWGVIKAIAKPIVDFVTLMIDSLAKLFSGDFSAESISAFKENISTAFNAMLDSIKARIKPVYDSIKTALSGVWTTVSTTINDFFSDESNPGTRIVSWLNGIFDRIREWMKTTFPGLSDSISNFFGKDNLTQKFGAFGGKLFELIDWMKTFFSQLSPEAKMLGGLAGAAILGVRLLTKKVNKVGEGAEGLNGAVVAAASGFSAGKLLKGVVIGGGIVAALSVLFDQTDIGKQVGSLFKTFWANVSSSIVGFFRNGIGDAVKDISGEMGNFVRQLFGSKGIGGKIGLISSASAEAADEMKTATETMLTKPGSFGEAIANFFKGIKETFSWDTLGPILAITAVIGAIVIVVKIIKAFKTFGEGFKSLAEALGQGFKNVTSSIKKVQFATETLGEKMLKIAGAVAILVGAVYALSNLQLDKAIQGVVGVVILMIAMGALIKSMKNTVKDMSVQDSLKMVVGLYGIAVAVGRMVNALMPFKGLTLEQVGPMMAALAGIVMSMGIVMSAAGKSKFDWKAGAGMLMFAYSIRILMKSLSWILQFRKDNVWDGNAIVAMIGSLIVICAALGGLAKSTKDTETGILQLAGLAAAIAILIHGLKQVTTIKEGMDFVKMGGTLLGIVAVLTGFVWAVGRMKNKGSLKDTDLWQLIGLAAGMVGIILALKSIADMKPEQLTNMGLAWGALIVGITGLIAVTNLTAKKSDGAKRGLSGSGLLGLAGLAIGLVGIILALKTLADMKPEQLGKMGVSWSALIIGISALIVVTNLTAKEGDKAKRGLKGGGMGSIIALALGLMGLILVLKSLADMQPEKLTNMGLAWGALIVGLTILIAAVNKTANEQGRGLNKSGLFGGMIAVCLGLIALIEVLKPLADMEWSDLGKMGIAWGAMVLGMTIMFAAVGKLMTTVGALKIFGGAKIALGTLGLILAIVAAYGAILLLTKDSDWKQTTAVAGGLAAIGLIMIAVAKAIEILSKVDVASGVKGIALMAAGIGSVVGILSALAPWVGSQIGDGIANAMSGMSRAANSLSNFSSIMSSVSGLESAKQKIETMAAIIRSLGSIKYFEDDVLSFSRSAFDLGVGMMLFQDAIKDVGDPESSKGIKMMEKLIGMKDQLVSFSSGFSGLLIGSKFTSIGAGLKNFDTETASMPDPESSNAFKTLAALANAADALNTINTIKISGANGLSTKISDLGSAMKLYAQGSQALTEDDISDERVKMAAQLLQRMSTLIEEDLSVGSFTLPDLPEVGDDKTPGTLSYFGVQLTTLAGGLSEYVKACKDIGFNAFKGLWALDVLASIRGKLMTQNGSVIPTFTDENGNSLDEAGLSAFGTELTALATGLSEFIKASGTIGNVQDGIDALNKFLTLKNELEAKKKEILDFVREWNKDVREQITEAQEDGITDGSDRAGRVSYTDALDYLTPEQITGSLTEFGLNIGGLGKALQTFANNVTFTPEQKEAFDNGMTSLDFLVKLQEKLPTVEGVVQWFNGHTTSFKELSEGIEALGGGLANFYRALTAEGLNYDNNLVNEALISIKTLAEISNIMWDFDGAVDELSNTAPGIGEKPRKLYDTVDYLIELFNLMRGLTTGMTANGFRIWDAGEPGIISMLGDFLWQFDNFIATKGGLQNLNAASMLSDLANAISTLVTAAKETKEAEVDFSSIGEQICNGIVAGIETGTSKVTAAARLMARKAYIAACKELGIQSPSRVFMMMGEYVGEGAAIGIENSQSGVGKAAAGLAQGAIDGFGDGNYVSQNFLEWYINNQTDTALAAIESDEDRLTKALESFNKLPGDVQNGMISQYAKYREQSYGVLLNDGTKAVKDLKKQAKQKHQDQLNNPMTIVDALLGTDKGLPNLDYAKNINKTVSEVTGKSGWQRAWDLWAKTVHEFTSPLKSDQMGKGATDAILKLMENGNVMDAAWTFLKETANPTGIAFSYGTKIGRIVRSFRLANHAGNILGSVGNFFGEHSELIELLNSPLAKVAGTWISQNREMFEPIIQAVLENGELAFNSISDFIGIIGEKFPEIEPKLNRLIEIFNLGGEDVGAAIDTFVSDLLADGSLAKLFNGTQFESMISWLTENYGTLGSTVKSFITTYRLSGGDLKTAITTFVNDLLKGDSPTKLTAGTPLETVASWLTENAGMLNASVKSAVDAYEQSGGNLKTTITTFLNDFVGGDTLTKLTAGTKYSSVSQLVTDLYTNLGPAVENAIATYESSGKDLKATITSFITDVISNPNAMTFLSSNFDFSKLISLVQTPINSALGSLGITTGDWLSTAMSTAFNSLIQNGGDWKKTTVSLGQELLANTGGWIGNLASTAMNFFNSDTAANALNWLKTAAVVSTGFMDDDTAGRVRSVMALLTGALDKDIPETPTITPIVDLTNVTAAGNMMDQLFGPRNVELSANGNLYARESVPTTNPQTEQPQQDLSWIESSINAVRDKISTLGTQISKMQIVLDTGGLVGAVTDGVNKNLGAKTTYRRRNN